MTESLLDAYECQILLSGCLFLSLNIKEPSKNTLMLSHLVRDIRLS